MLKEKYFRIYALYIILKTRNNRMIIQRPKKFIYHKNIHTRELK